MNEQELKDRLDKKREKAVAFAEQTKKAIEHYEQLRLEGPHVAHIIDLLYKSLADSKKLIRNLEYKLPTERKFNQPYMEK